MDFFFCVLFFSYIVDHSYSFISFSYCRPHKLAEERHRKTKQKRIRKKAAGVGPANKAPPSKESPSCALGVTLPQDLKGRGGGRKGVPEGGDIACAGIPKDPCMAVPRGR